MTTTLPYAITATLALLLASGAGAQTTVYESRDAEGNVTFSDESSPDSKTIEIERTSVADAPKAMPRDPEEEQEQERTGSNGGPGEEPADIGDSETVYGDDYPYDDPRLRREAARELREPGAPGVEPLPEDERHDAARYDERSSGDPIENADRNAERSDITGPNAEYRNNAPPAHHGGGGRR